MGKRIQHLSKEAWEKQYIDVDQKTKDLWAVEMDILTEFERVCNEHNLRWYADGGTLLGAVRHQGFIPWDDDIDIIMPYEDYVLLSKLHNEFKAPYFLQTWETEDGFEPYLMKIRRSDTTGYNFREECYPAHFNKGISIDIFALCNIPDNVLLGYTQLVLLKLIRALIHGYESKRDGVQTANNKLLDWGLRNLYNITRLVVNHRQLSSWYCTIACWEKKRTKLCGPTMFSPGKKKLIWRTSWYDKTVMLKYMDREIPSPYKWDKRLTRQYGDYWTPVKGINFHGGLTFDPYHSYTDSFM